MRMGLSELGKIVRGRLKGADAPFASVSIDTRTLRPGDLFVAIKGARFDGHDFIDQASAKGAAAALVEREIQSTLPQLIVEDTRLALAELAGAWRRRSSVKLMGITGSNGKTTVKEMLAAIVGIAAPVLSTRGNLNNEIGAPLTLLSIQPEHRYAVVELGANRPGEIAYTARFAQPHIALITNAGAAHLEGFGTLEGVARAKGELIASLTDEGIAVLNEDDQFIGLWKEMAEVRRVITFGFSERADVRALPSSLSMGIEGGRFQSCFELIHRENAYSMRLALAGRHNVVNALAAGAAALAAGLTVAQIQEGLSRVDPVPGRLQPVPGLRGSLLIDDSYNANPASFEAGLDVLAGLGQESWVILGAFAELGEESAELHAYLGYLAKSKGVRRLFATGPDADKTVQSFGEGASYFKTPEALIKTVHPLLHGNLAVLIKGSRSQRMEYAVDMLSSRMER